MWHGAESKKKQQKNPNPPTPPKNKHSQGVELNKQTVPCTIYSVFHSVESERYNIQTVAMAELGFSVGGGRGQILVIILNLARVRILKVPICK